MSRVEPKHRQQDEQRRAEDNRREPQIGHTPTKSEGEERDVDEALRNQEQRR